MTFQKFEEKLTIKKIDEAGAGHFDLLIDCLLFEASLFKICITKNLENDFTHLL